MFFAGGVVLDTASEDVLGKGSDRVVAMAAASAAAMSRVASSR